MSDPCRQKISLNNDAKKMSELIDILTKIRDDNSKILSMINEIIQTVSSEDQLDALIERIERAKNENSQV